jgi:hypothetical protein
LVQAEVQVPATQKGSALGQSAFDLHVVPATGKHTPAEEQVKPVGQAVEPEQLCTQAPSSQTKPALHWLENLQTVEAGSHEPETHTSPFEQSELLAHGHGPSLPPQVMHSPL